MRLLFEKHTLDTDRRERLILVALAFMMLWMGIGSADFTRRSESSTRNVFELMKRPGAYNADVSVPVVPPSVAAREVR